MSILRRRNNGNGNGKARELEIVELRRRPVEWLEKPFQMDVYDFIGMLTRYGFGRKEICEVLGITVQNFDGVMARDDKLREAVEDNRRAADLMVVNSLFKRAMGYNYVETVIEERSGREVKRVYKHLPPDVTACIFWLKNRMRDEWADTYRTEITLRDRMELANRQKAGGRE